MALFQKKAKAQEVTNSNMIYIIKGGGGILLNSYKVVEIFVHIIYRSTFGVYEKVLGISRPEKFFLNFHTSPALHRGGLFLGLSACNFISFLSMWYIFFVIS